MDTECHACIGGTNVRADIAKLELGQHVVVGTPGRVYDMIQRKALGQCMVKNCSVLHLILLFFPVLMFTDPRNIKMFVLDEADEMLSRGFKDQIYDVFRKMPSNIQVCTVYILVCESLLHFILDGFCCM